MLSPPELTHKHFFEKLDSLQTELINQQDSLEIKTQIHAAKKDIAEVIEYQTRGTMFHTGMQWHNEGERSSKYFFAWEKANAHKKVMSAIYLSDGTLTRDRQMILAEQAKNYRKLFRADTSIAFHLVNESGIKITDEDKMLLELPLNIEELHKVVKGMSSGKSPGCDGLGCEFYLCIWDLLAKPLLNALNYAFEANQLHLSAHRGIKTIISKKDRDIFMVKN